MAKSTAKITLSRSCDIPFNKLVLSQANVRQVMAGISIEDLAEDIGRRTLLQSLSVRRQLNEQGEETGLFEVPAGGRRFRALELLVKQKRLAADAAVPCVVREDGLAEEDSLAENVFRVALHPVDQYRSFATLRARGVEIDDIALRFGVTAHVVEQRLKLAAVSPVILDHFVNGKAGLELVMAFTVSDDHKRQEEIWDAGETAPYLRTSYHIRRMLTESQVEASDPRALFVGMEAYCAAGGFVARDLFHDDDGGWLQDPALLDRLVSEKLEAAAAEVRAAGWKWVEVAVSFPYGHANGLRRIAGQVVPLTEDQVRQRDEAARSYDDLAEPYASEDDMPDDVLEKLNALGDVIDTFAQQVFAWEPDEIAMSGVFLSIDAAGHLKAERGYVRPADELPVALADAGQVPGSDEQTLSLCQAPAAGPGTTPEAPEAIEDDEALKPLPDKLLGELSAYRTIALRNAVANHPDVALTLLLEKLCGGMFYRGFANHCLQASIHAADLRDQGPDLKDSPSVSAVQQRHQNWQTLLPKHPEALWDWLTALDEPSRLGLLAHCVSFGVNATHAKPDRYGAGPSAHGIAERMKGVDHLARAVGLDMVEAGWRPGVHNYLNRVSKPLILQAVQEARGDQFASMIDHLKKGDMATEAERLLEGTGWLPAPLRLDESDRPVTEVSGDDDGGAELPAFLADEDTSPADVAAE